MATDWRDPANWASSGRPAPDPHGRGMWGNRLSASIDSYQGNLWGLAEATTGSETARDMRERNEYLAQRAREAAGRQGAITSYKDVDGIGSAANYVGGLAVDSLPYLGEAFAGGLIGRGLAVGARAAGSAARDMGMVAAERGAAAQAGRAGLAGGAIASYPSAVGDVLSSQREESGGQMDLLSSGLLGVGYAGLNAVGVSGAISRGGFTRNIVRSLDEAQGVTGGLKRAGTAAGITALQEGASETGQEFLNQIGRNQVNPDAGYFGPEALDRYGESFVGGAALGNAFGALGGARRSREYVNGQQDLLRAQYEQRQREAAESERQTRVLSGLRPQGMPLQGFLDSQIAPPPMDDRARTVREDEYEAMLDTPTGQRVGAVANGELERDVTVGETIGMGSTAAGPTDPRVLEALGSKPPKKAVTLGTQLYQLVDSGKITEEEADEQLNDLAAQKGKVYNRVGKFITERSNVQPGIPGPAVVVDGAAAGGSTQPAGSVGNLGGVPGSPGRGGDAVVGPAVASGAAVAPVGAGDAGGVSGALTTVDPATGVKTTVAPYVEPSRGTGVEAAPEAPEQAEFRRGFAEKLTTLPVEDRTLLERWLGVAVDAEGGLILADESVGLTTLGKGMTATRGKNKGKAGVSREAARKRVLGALKAAGAPDGISPKQLYQKLGFQLSDLDLESLDRMTADVSGAPTGAPLESDAVDGPVTAVEGGLDAVEEGDDTTLTLAASDAPEGYAEDDVGEKEAADESEVEEMSEPWVSALADDVKAGRVTADDMHEASYAVDIAGGPRAWVRLTQAEKAAAARMYAAARLRGDPAILEVKKAAYEHRQTSSTGRTGQDADAGAVRSTAQGDGRTGGVDDGPDGGAEDASGDRLQVQGDRPAPVVVKRASRAIAAPSGALVPAAPTPAASTEPKKPRVFATGNKPPVKAAADSAPVAAIKTPDEQWATLAAETPGMPAWGDLNSRQRSQWTDLAYRDQGNLAAAARVSGGDPGQVSKSAEDDEAVTLPESQTRAVTRNEVLALPGAQTAQARLQKLGLGHVLTWAQRFYLARGTSPDGKKVADGWVSGRATVVSMAVTMNAEMDDITTRWTLSHEAGHVADMAPYGGVYSADARLQPGGAVVEELRALYDGSAPGSTWHDVLDYPLNVKPYFVPSETVAQLFATYASPGLRPLLEKAAPKSFRFIEQVVRHVRLQTAPAATTDYDAQIQARRQSFTAQLRAEGRASAGAQAKPVVPETPRKNVGGNRAARAAAAFEREMAASERIQAALPPKAQDAMTRMRDVFKRVAPYMLTNFQIMQQWADTKIGPTLKKFMALTDAMKRERTRQLLVFDAVAVDWDELPKAARAALDAMMMRATMDQTHPDKAFDDELNKHLHRKVPAEMAAARLAHGVLAAQWAKLDKPTQAVYVKARDTLQKSWEQRSTAYMQMVSDMYHDQLVEALENNDAAEHERVEKAMEKALAEHTAQMAAIKGPYFPLKRFGEYLAIGESPAYAAAVKAMELADKGSDPEAKKAARKAVDKLKKSKTDYVVSAHENRAAMERTLAKYQAQGLVPRSALAGLRDDGIRAVSKTTLKQLEDAVANKLSTEDSKPVLEAMREVFLRGLPELHALHREAQRMGVEGASTDMLRAFSATGESHAFYGARMMYAKDHMDSLLDLRAKSKGDTDLEHVHREMQHRAALDMTFTKTPFQDMASSFTWAWTLGTSPAAVAINATQPFLVTAPVLAGKFGMRAASREMGRASRDALAVLKAARFKDGKWDWWSGISEDSIPGASRNEDRAAIRVLMERGAIDEGRSHELNMFAQDGSRTLAKVNRVTGWAMNQVEVTNRMSTGLAAFRLARQKGTPEAEAIDYAYDVVIGTQFDYSQEGSARFMRQGGGVPLAKLVFQFRRYQQGMLYLLGDNIRKSFGTGEDAKTARATVAYLAITTGMTAGITGLPFIGTALALASLGRDDDDEDGNAATALRNALFDMTGDKDVANVLAKGLPALLGVDLSKRVGQADLLNPLAFARYEGTKTGRDVVKETAFTLMGPWAGLTSNIVDGAMMAASGDFVKGIEKMVPKGATDVMRATRYAFGAGLTDRQGDQILGPDEVGAWNAAFRAVGLQSVQEANYFEGTSAKMKVKTAVEDRKARISNEFKMAVRDGEFVDVRRRIQEFNADHPTAKILPKDEIGWRKAAVKSASQRDETGIKLDPKRDKNYQEVMRFAR